MTYNCNLIN